MKVAELITSTPLRLATENRARKDAESGIYAPPDVDPAGTYQQQLMQGAIEHAYIFAHGKRLARLKRMAEKESGA